MMTLGETLNVAETNLTVWAARDDTQAQPAVRQAANVAMDAIDAMLCELHEVRSRLVGEIRQADDVAARRVDLLLAHKTEPHAKEDS